MAPLYGHSHHATPSHTHDEQLVRPLTKKEKQLIYQNAATHTSREKSRVLFTKYDHAWKELDMDLLIENLDRTVLGIGAEEFRRLMQPITDIKELEKRTAILRELEENPQLFEQLDRTIQTLSLFEHHFLHPFDIQSSPMQALFGKGYVEGMFETMASVSQWLGLPAGTDAFTVAAMFAKETFTFKFTLWLQSTSTFLTTLALLNEKDHIKHDWKKFKNGAWYWGKPLGAWFLFANIFNLFGSTIATGWTVKNILGTIPSVDDNVLDTAKGFSYMQSLSETLTQAPILSQNSAAQKLIRFFNETSFKPKEIKELMIALGTRLLAEIRYGTFASAQRAYLMIDSAFAYDTLHKTKNYFLPLFQALGTIDAYLSIIRLKKEYAMAGIPTTFATFNSNNTITLKNIHNPLIPYIHSVPNSFYLGTDMGRDALFTGPHGCGKTTGMKSIVVGAYILGQSITLVPAEYAEFTPITILATYFNITDNLAEGVSSFMAEEQRMQELQVLLDNLDPQQIALVAIDEPYAKTIQQIGEDKVYLFAKGVAENQHNNTRLLLATHFELPSVLEKETHGLVKNLQPELIEKESGSFEPTFKIIDGAADWWFKDVNKRNRFINWLGGKISTDKVKKNSFLHEHDHAWHSTAEAA